ncbi:hypothetical protein V6N12_009231 [Hibiscus sabdariffa]|uniref:Reverse transcriptase zinc-binding domain-containing protein n=1 Tax=Hibiscus sabdariffa TaxID=183260 RepID=A0ABR2BIZ6_9ROSI
MGVGGIYSSPQRGGIAPYCVASAYMLCSPPTTDPDPLWEVIKHYRGLRRVRMFIWLACHGGNMTKSERVRRHLADDSSCDACSHVVENALHVLCDSQQARQL